MSTLIIKFNFQYSGNLVEFGFESPGSCLIAREHIETCREAVNKDIEKKIEHLLDECLESILIDENNESLS